MRFRNCAGYLLASLVVMSPATASPLSKYTWKSRVLLIVSIDGDDKRAIEQRLVYERSSMGMFDRDIVLIQATDDSEDSRQIRSEFSVGVTNFRVYLVGKDGNTALSSDMPLSADYLFQRIDAMPMRKEEVQRIK